MRQAVAMLAVPTVISQLMALMNAILPMYGLMLVQPVMEFSGCLIAVLMYRKMRRKMSAEPVAA